MKKILLLACAILAEAQQPLQITTPSLPQGEVGLSYSIQLTDSGSFGTDSWSASGLPSGMGCSTAGVISGVPGSSGTFSVTVNLSSSGRAGKGFVSRSYTLSIAARIALSPATLPTATVAVPYSFNFSVTGGSGPIVWTGLNLPIGLSLDSIGGLSGTPTSAGTFTFTIQVSDALGQVSASRFSLVVLAQLQITTMSLPPSTVSATYFQNISASGGMAPYVFSVSASGGLPPGLALGSGGSLTGTPTAMGVYSFTVVVMDSLRGVANQGFTVTINPVPAITNTSPLPPATLGGANYTLSFQATGGTPPLTFTLIGGGALGLAMNSSGTLSGTPSVAGTFSLGVTVTDSNLVSATKQFQITVSPLVQLLMVAPGQLDFTAPAGGDAPAALQFSIVSSDGSAVSFAIQPDGGQNAPAPQWLIVHSSKGVTPAVLTVAVDQTGLGVGPYSARVVFSVPGNSAQTPVIAKVTLTVAAAAPQLEALPGFLRIAARFAAPGNQQRVIVLHNSGGGGSFNFSAAVVHHSSWILSVTPANGPIAPNQPVPVTIVISTQGLGVGSYREVIRFTWPGGSLDVPVTLFVADQGPILSLDLTGFQFLLNQGSGASNSQTVRVLNLGDPAATVHWNAQLLTGQEWLVLGSTQGTASATAPGSVALTVNPAASALALGGHYALMQFTDPNALGSPQLAMAVLNVLPAGSPVQPVLSSPPLFFNAPIGSVAKLTATVRLDVSSSAAVAFQASAQTDDGGNWLQASPASGTASTANPGQIAVSVMPAGLFGGVHKGTLAVSLGGGIVRTADVTVVVTGGASPAAGFRPALAGCTPTRLAVTLAGLSGNFSTPAGWPADLAAQLNDDCANPVTNGSVVANFSNGDPPLSLSSDNLTGTYSAAWQPGRVSSPVTVTVRASAGTLPSVSAQIGGAITPNSAPVLAPEGTLHNLNPVVGGALAPGTVAQVFGSGLAGSTTSPGVIPLPTTFNGTYMVVGGLNAPLYYLSGNQLVIEIPNELAPGREYAEIVSVNGALTLPDTIDVNPLEPGVAAFQDGSIIAQHAADYTLVDPGHPAHPGEVLIVYLAGMGATNPSVPSGQPAPLATLAPALTQPTVTVDGQNAPVIFAGLTPGGIGLFQIDFTVPATARTGSLTVEIAQAGVTANSATLPVGP